MKNGMKDEGKTMNERRMEMAEAIDAGNRALYSLREAESKLKSAGNWGLFDLFGGGFLAGMIKHDRIESASECINHARRDLVIFERELRDVHLSDELDIDVGDFLTAADFLFDGAVADYLVQRKISKAKKDVARAIDEVQEVLTLLMKQFEG